MGDNLGLSLGLQAVPKTYENIYMSNLKEKRAGEAAASKAKAEDEEALRKYEGDFKVISGLYHKSQEPAVKALASKYYSTIEKNRLERPLTWQNDMPRINTDFELERKKLELQGENINKLYGIPVDERTSAQKEVISRLDNNQDISGYVDPTNSVTVTPDGYIDIGYRMNKGRANVQGEVNKKIKDYQVAFISDPRTISKLGTKYDKFYRQGIPSTVADAKKLQEEYGLLDTPPSVEQVIGDAVVGDPDLVHHAMEAKRKDILDLHERAIKDNLTEDEVSQQGNKIIYDYLLGFAHPGVTTSIQRVPQPSTGGGASYAITELTGDAIQPINITSTAFGTQKATPIKARQFHETKININPTEYFDAGSGKLVTGNVNDIEMPASRADIYLTSGKNITVKDMMDLHKANKINSIDYAKTMAEFAKNNNIADEEVPNYATALIVEKNTPLSDVLKPYAKILDAKEVEYLNGNAKVWNGTELVEKPILVRLDSKIANQIKTKSGGKTDIGVGTVTAPTQTAAPKAAKTVYSNLRKIAAPNGKTINAGVKNGKWYNTDTNEELK